MARNDPVWRARRLARRGADASVRLTSPLRMWPTFLIVGAQRCGTTSMFKTVMQHPGAARPFLRKGVHFFDEHYDEGPSWYRGHFPIAATSSLRRLGRSPVVTGESSPYYMFNPVAPARIAETLPGVKVIALLRDPVERAYSAHSHELAKGFETLPFAEALDAEAGRIEGEAEKMLADPTYRSFDLQHHAYVRRGEYITQVRRLVETFGEQNVLVVDSQVFFETPEVAFAPVLEFLGLPPHDGIVFERHNARSRVALDPGLQRRLDEHYRPFDEELAAWWGKVPSWRR